LCCAHSVATAFRNAVRRPATCVMRCRRWPSGLPGGDVEAAGAFAATAAARSKRHSLQSLLSHLAHSVASPVGLVNQLVSSLAIMKYPFHMLFQFHYIFVSFLRVPSSVLPSSALPFIVISYHLCQAGWYPALPAHLLTPTQSAPSFLALLLEGERCGVFWK
jgi:hypothetical protein